MDIIPAPARIPSLVVARAQELKADEVAIAYPTVGELTVQFVEGLRVLDGMRIGVLDSSEWSALEAELRKALNDAGFFVSSLDRDPEADPA